MLANMKALPAALVSTNGGPVRAALWDATKPILDRARELAPKRTGNLSKNIIAVRDSNPKAHGANERYIITIRKRRYTKKSRAKLKRKSNGKIDYKASGDAFYGWYVEFGTEKMKAEPFIRPAFESEKDDSLDKFKDSLTIGVANIVSGLPK